MVFYSVLEVTPTSNDWVANYLQSAANAMARHGGKYLARTTSHERVEGKADGEEPALRIIIEWPSKQAAINFMEDAEYVPYLEARTKGSISHHFLIEGKDDLA